MSDHRPIAPGDTIGVVGAGQLGRMLALAAARLGLRTHVFAPESGPAFDICAARTLAAYDDAAALATFAAQCQVVTYEFENIPAETARILAETTPVRPDPQALANTQDRLAEKLFLGKLGIATAAFLPVDDAGGLARAVAQIGRPSILKTRRFGYDGKGQAMIREGADLAALFRSLGAQAAILEGLVPFAREISIVAARGLKGEFAAFDICENRHEHHILASTVAPARIASVTAEKAVAIAATIAEALDYVGVLAVEMFVVEGARAGGARTETLLVNEIAPRVHNSGHWTLDGAATSQFEQHVRAICGWPLGSPLRLGAVEMRNLIGADTNAWRALLAEPGACLHLYGKHEARAGRKMGHVTRIRKPSGT
ncbi:MAG TPA: 5-(carboxyamino)imidazole ribonucleotide synthase [Beijerinckiaceae bacterium]|nr:5-(carboxyamino)imidazole ribonucleotide synthase [Beijerinckiaceae bacterium]